MTFHHRYARNVASARAGLFGLLMLVAGGAAAVPAYTMDNIADGATLGNPPFTLGSQFSVNAAISVDALGVFDNGQDGLADIYELGLWDSGGTLLASTFLPNGVTAPLVNQFRYASIAPVLLGVGTYRVGALFLTGNDPLLGPGFPGATNFATASEITFQLATFASGATLTDPTANAGAAAGYFGANFLFNSVADIPEPGSLLLLGLGLAGMGWKRRRLASV